MNQENRLLKIECDNYSKYDNIYFFLSELLSEKGRESIKFYFSNNNIKNIIIYGAGTFARVLCDFINKESLCNITGVIDRDKNEEFGFHEFINIDEINEYKYDVIVITPLSSLENIIKLLINKNVNHNKIIYIGELTDYKRRYDIYENGLHI